MCGIAGWYRRTGRLVPQTIVKTQCDTILHRGPDDDGILIDGDFGFGMRRLSILDIAGGHQPMETRDGRFAIVFNGEIFNHIDVRQKLADYPFVTHSDTETILAAFARWGNDAWPELEGMFAVAVWDRRDRVLTLARDPLGIKPLYVAEQSGGLSFASELKALRMLPDRFDVDDRAVHDFFSYGHVRKPRSIYRQVVTLDPGHFLTIGPTNRSETRTYWTPRIRPGRPMSDQDWVEEMRTRLIETTRRHLQSDVPVASFLSGGIDSSAITAAMVRTTDQSISAFTIGHPGAKIDETDAARRIAAHLGCEHVVAPLDPDESLRMLPAILRCFDEPFADMAAIPTWFASKLAAERVKVVLCGEGGDELFAGYKRHRNARLLERSRSYLGLAGPLVGMLDRWPATGSARANRLRQYAQRFAEFTALSDGYQQFFAATQISSRALRSRLFDPEFQSRHEAEEDFRHLEHEYFGAAEARNLSALEQFLFADLTLNMPSAMLTRLDRASMAHSLEARVPFLSHKLVDWALTIPEPLKLRGTTGKRILRQAIAPWLPADILTRPKQGFQIPMADWLRGEFGTAARDIWCGSGASGAGYFRRDAVDRLFDEHRAATADHSRMLYAITVFALWWDNQHRARTEPIEAHAG